MADNILVNLYERTSVFIQTKGSDGIWALVRVYAYRNITQFVGFSKEPVIADKLTNELVNFMYDTYKITEVDDLAFVKIGAVIDTGYLEVNKGGIKGTLLTSGTHLYIADNLNDTSGYKIKSVERLSDEKGIFRNKITIDCEYDKVETVVKVDTNVYGWEYTIESSNIVSK